MTDWAQEITTISIATTAILLHARSLEYVLILWLISALQQQSLHILVQLMFVGLSICSSMTLKEPFKNTVPAVPPALLSVYLLKIVLESVLGNQHWSLYLVLAALSFLATVTYRFRQERVKHQSSAFLDVDSWQGNLNESRWYEWSPNETSNWIAGQEPEIQKLLEGEQIEGSQLPLISVKQWFELGLPFGKAMRLVQRIQDLTQAHPAPSEEQDEGGFLAEHDRMYNQSARYTGDSGDFDFESSSVAQRQRTRGGNAELVGLPDMSYAKDVARSRFGIRLPDVADGDDWTDAGRSKVEATAEESPPTTAPRGLFSASSPPMGLPKDFLDNMPPHIAAIASRKPDLVQKILESKKGQQQGERSELLEDSNQDTYDSMRKR